MNLLKTAWSWLIWSSQNPDKISTTLKGGIPFLILLGASPHVQGLLQGNADNIAQFLVQAAMVVSGLIGAFGLGRKIVNSFV